MKIHCKVNSQQNSSNPLQYNYNPELTDCSTQILNLSHGQNSQKSKHGFWEWISA